MAMPSQSSLIQYRYILNSRLFLYIASQVEKKPKKLYTSVVPWKRQIRNLNPAVLWVFLAQASQCAVLETIFRNMEKIMTTNRTGGGTDDDSSYKDSSLLILAPDRLRPTAKFPAEGLVVIIH